MMNLKKGFTLTEILIVVVIIGILAALALPRFMRQDERGIVAEAVAMLSAIRQAEESYRLENSVTTYATDLSATGPLGVDVSSSTKFTYAVDGTSGTATATRTPAGACTSTDFGSCTITLTSAGVWGGTHPFRPT